MPSDDPKAKAFPYVFRRRLPHIQRDGRTYFLTFCTHEKWILPKSVRGNVLDHCLHDHGIKMNLLAAVIMPDHVHLLLSPLPDIQGNPYTLSEILKGIKGSSAVSINKVLGRKGKVWQEETFDHILRTSECLKQKTEYLANNPVRRGLVARSEEYPWIWMAEVEKKP
jgi:REP element-mobilizing transposase RayT